MAYDVRRGETASPDTRLTLSPFNDSDLLDVALLSFFYPQNPLLGERIWSGPSAAVYYRSPKPKPLGFPSTDRASGPGIIFAGFQALGSIPHPLVFCLHDHRGNDRERNNFFLMDVVSAVKRIAAQLPPPRDPCFIARLRTCLVSRSRRRWATHIIPASPCQ